MRLPIAGGNWNNGADNGVFNLNLNNPRSNSNNNIGFRGSCSALLLRRVMVRAHPHGGAQGAQHQRGLFPL
jgi:hypothetical protein